MKEIVNQYTRKIDREYQSILMKKTKLWADWNPEIDLSCVGDANDYLVKSLFWLSQDDVDNMTVSEFEELLQKANEAKTPNFTQKW